MCFSVNTLAPQPLTGCPPCYPKPWFIPIATPKTHRDTEERFARAHEKLRGIHPASPPKKQFAICWQINSNSVQIQWVIFIRHDASCTEHCLFNLHARRRHPPSALECSRFPAIYFWYCSIFPPFLRQSDIFTLAWYYYTAPNGIMVPTPPQPPLSMIWISAFN